MTDVLFFVIEQGADWGIQLVLQNDSGTPLNLTGCQIHLQVRPSPTSPTVLLDLSTQAGTITLNGSPGQINWDVSAEQTAAFSQTYGIVLPAAFGPNCVPFGSYDLLVEWPNGQITRELCGQIALSLGTTQTA
jgi:hypothetical protein